MIENARAAELLSDLGQFKAICIDTNVYDGLKGGFEGGLLKQLEQFSDGVPVRLLMPEVVFEETRRHAVVRAEESVRTLRKSLKDSGFGIGLAREIQTKTLTQIIGSASGKEIAEKRIDAFIEATGTNILATSDYVSVTALQQLYFDVRPPFAASGDKKNEFPDAMALLTIEGWADEEDSCVLVVSNDGDWKAFCAESRRLHIVHDLAHAIGLFQHVAAANKFANEFENVRGSDAWSRIEHSVEQALWDLSPTIEANSEYSFEDEIVDIKLLELFIDDDRATLVSATKDEWVLQVSLRADVDVEVNFRFSVRDGFDRDYVPMGGAREEASVQIPFSAVLTFVAPGDAKDDEPDLADIELLPKSVSIDFGYVVPQY